MTTETPVLTLRDVTLQRGERVILDRVSLDVQPGEHWALLGPNGAGKSTILSFCGATAHPSSGTVHVLGKQLGRVELQELRRSIGHVNPRLTVTTNPTIEDIVLTGFTGSIERPLRWEPSSAELEAAREATALIGLGEKSHFRWSNLSQGERGRALIARALVGRPDLVLLDEPATGLDVAAREQLLDTLTTFVRTPRLSSILVTHHLEELPPTTTHAALVAHGRIIEQGLVDEVLTSEHVSTAFEHPIEIEKHEGRWSARSARRAPVEA